MSSWSSQSPKMTPINPFALRDQDHIMFCGNYFTTSVWVGKILALSRRNHPNKALVQNQDARTWGPVRHFKCLGSQIKLTKAPQLPLICKIVLDLTGQLLWACLSTLASATTGAFFAIFADPYTPYLTYTKTFNICINLEPVDNSRKLFDLFKKTVSEHLIKYIRKTLTRLLSDQCVKSQFQWTLLWQALTV